MPASTEPRSGLFYGWSLGESGWKSGMDANLVRLGRFGFHLTVIDRTTTAPPATPNDGDAYIVPAAATGAWAGKTGQIAVWSAVDAAWVFGQPRTGWVAFVQAEVKLSAFSAGAWTAGVAL